MPLSLPELAMRACRWAVAPWPADLHRQQQEKDMSRTGGRAAAPAPAVVSTDLLTRTSWVDANTAYRQIHKGRAYGNTCALWLRAYLQRHLFNLGCFIQRHCGKVLFVGLLLLSLCCVGLKTATIETNVEKLWVEAGGRLQHELEYTRKTLGEGSGTTYELLIQTPKTGQDVLSTESLLLHYKALHAATKVTVNMFDITWKFRELCYAPSFPIFENPTLDRILAEFLPCLIITPLDCFWEGSKLLGPDYGVYIPGYAHNIKWTTLNPHYLGSLKQFNYGFNMDGLLDLFERAGIGSAYQNRPCLDPTDRECPMTAPNKMDLKEPDIGAELTGGCSGIATKYMHWQENLILGGVQKNRTGHVKRAEALQSIVQLMGEKQMYEFYSEHNKVSSLRLDWSVDKAKQVLDAWKRKFTQEVKKLTDPELPGDVHAFSSTSLLDILQEFSQISTVRVTIGYVVMLFYACISLLRWTDAIQSQSGIGIAGVLLVALSVAGGLGFCSALGIKFNASTTQILPFLALGLGVDDMFLIAYTFAENANRQDIAYMKQTGECMKRTGVSVLLTSLSNSCAFFMAAIIPIPALRAFTLQAAILVLFNLATILLVYPAVVSLDLIRREEKRVDFFCCFRGSMANRVIELQPSAGNLPPDYQCSESPPPPYNEQVVHQTVTRTGPDGTHPTTVLAQHGPCRSPSLNSVCPSTTSSHQCLTPEDGQSCQDRCGQSQHECCNWSLTWLAKDIYGPLLENTPAKVFVFIASTALLILGIVGAVRVKDGLDLTDIVPHNTHEYQFLEAQSKYFGFYNMYAVTKEDFDYPSEQKLLYEYHKAFQKVDKIIKKEDGTVPDFWLDQLRSWLLDVQEAFDIEVQQGSITRDGWNKNASELGILGFKLMIQTGDVDKPIDRSRVSYGRLVDEEGIIYPDAFYNYISAWTSMDTLAYASTQADFHPLPREWYHDVYDIQEGNDEQYEVPKSQPFVYAQLSFYLTDLSDTQEITATIKEVREICKSFEEKGLPNFPSGIPFTFWEQYINLRFYLTLALVCVLAGIMLVLSILLMSPWAAVVVVAVLAMMVVELFGFMGLVGIKLSAIPAVILIVSVGIGVEFTVHVLLGFVTSIGSRNHRMKMSLEHMFAPVVHGAVSTLLGVIMLAGAEFDFIVKYFFVVLVALVVLGVLNGLVLLPVLLSILGPTAEVVPTDNSEKIPPPTPEPSPPPPSRPVRRPRVYPRIPSDLSLSTITEEPTQYSSHEIIIHPEVVVETTVPGGAGEITTTTTSNGGRNSSASTSSHSAGPHVTTTVRATAKVKVQVHTPLPGSVEEHRAGSDQEHSYKSKRRKLKELESADNTDSDSCNKSS